MSEEFQYYFLTWRGSIIASEEDFTHLWREAACYVERITFGRSRAALCNENTRYAVMNCMCAVAECIAEFEAEGETAQTGVASENVDGYSVSYRSAEELQSDKAAKILRICRLYLPPEMMYCGV